MREDKAKHLKKILKKIKNIVLIMNDIIEEDPPRECKVSGNCNICQIKEECKSILEIKNTLKNY